MFDFFKRSPPPIKQAKKARSNPRSIDPPPPPETVPQAIECSDDSAWQDWEDSSLALDSQMQPLHPSQSVRERNKESPSQFDDLDPFSRATKSKNR